MEPGSFDSIRTAGDLHKEVIFYVSACEVPSHPQQVKLTDRSWPFLCSFILHAVFIAIICNPAFQYPIVISSETATFWFYPMSPPAYSAETDMSQLNPPVSPAVQQETPGGEPGSQFKAPPEVSDRVDLPESSPETSALPSEPALTVATPPPVKKTAEAAKSSKQPMPPRNTTPLIAAAPIKITTVPKETEPESERALPAIDPVVPGKDVNKLSRGENVLKSEGDSIAQHNIEQKQQEAEKVRRDQLVREREQQAALNRLEQERFAVEQKQQKLKAAEKAQREQIAREQELLAIQNRLEQERFATEKEKQKLLAAEKALREQEQLAVRSRLDRERAALEKARLKQLAVEQELRKKKLLEEAIHKQELERVSRIAAERAASALAARQNKSLPQHNTKASEPQIPVKQAEKPVEKNAAQQIEKPLDKPMSVALPHIKGDIKLVMAGKVLPGVTVTFTEFKQSRRDRALSRAEWRRSTIISPLIAHEQETTREVVIARASHGTYTITAEPSSEASHVTVSLKLYEGSSRAVSREVGTFTISRKRVLCKILMPEGILWDDNAAFSGNMEDSDGVIKFNTETGLMWKEYAE